MFYYQSLHSLLNVCIGVRSVASYSPWIHLLCLFSQHRSARDATTACYHVLTLVLHWYWVQIPLLVDSCHASRILWNLFLLVLTRQHYRDAGREIGATTVDRLISYAVLLALWCTSISGNHGMGARILHIPIVYLVYCHFFPVKLRWVTCAVRMLMHIYERSIVFPFCRTALCGSHNARTEPHGLEDGRTMYESLVCRAAMSGSHLLRMVQHGNLLQIVHVFCFPLCVSLATQSTYTNDTFLRSLCYPHSTTCRVKQDAKRIDYQFGPMHLVHSIDTGHVEYNMRSDDAQSETMVRHASPYLYYDQFLFYDSIVSHVFVQHVMRCTQQYVPVGHKIRLAIESMMPSIVYDALHVMNNPLREYNVEPNVLSRYIGASKSKFIASGSEDGGQDSPQQFQSVHHWVLKQYISCFRTTLDTMNWYDDSWRRSEFWLKFCRAVTKVFPMRFPAYKHTADGHIPPNDVLCEILMTGISHSFYQNHRRWMRTHKQSKSMLRCNYTNLYDWTYAQRGVVLEECEYQQLYSGLKKMERSIANLGGKYPDLMRVAGPRYVSFMVQM